MMCIDNYWAASNKNVRLKNAVMPDVLINTIHSMLSKNSKRVIIKNNKGGKKPEINWQRVSGAVI